MYTIKLGRWGDQTTGDMGDKTITHTNYEMNIKEVVTVYKQGIKITIKKYMYINKENLGIM